MPRSSSQVTSALYVRLPAADGAKLDRAAEVLRTRKKDLVAALVSQYVDPDTEGGRAALGQLAALGSGAGEQPENSPAVGFYSFHPRTWPEVLTTVQAAELLQVEEGLVVQLAESGHLPARRLGSEWRFSKASLMSWLSGA